MITSELSNVRVRLEPEKHAEAQRRAKENRRSLAAEIRYGYERYLALTDQSEAPNGAEAESKQ